MTSGQLEGRASLQALVEAARVALEALHQLHPQQFHMSVGLGICEWRPCQRLRQALAQAEALEKGGHHDP